MSTSTTYHRDGTISTWNVYTQDWITRAPAADLYADDRIMSTLSREERLEIEARAAGWPSLAAARRWVRQLERAADDEGTIQAGSMVGLSTDPRWHTTTGIMAAIRGHGLSLLADTMEQEADA